MPLASLALTFGRPTSGICPSGIPISGKCLSGKCPFLPMSFWRIALQQSSFLEMFLVFVSKWTFEHLTILLIDRRSPTSSGPLGPSWDWSPLVGIGLLWSLSGLVLLGICLSGVSTSGICPSKCPSCKCHSGIHPTGKYLSGKPPSGKHPSGKPISGNVISKKYSCCLSPNKPFDICSCGICPSAMRPIGICPTGIRTTSNCSCQICQYLYGSLLNPIS